MILHFTSLHFHGEIIAEWGGNIGNIISDESSIYTSSSFMIEADFLHLYDGRILN